MTRSRLGGLAAGLGGAFWTVKALAILVSGIQPPLLFEVAPVLFAGGLVGLHATVPEGQSHRARTGLILALASGAAAILALILKPAASSEDSFSPWVLSSFLLNLSALIVLGVLLRRTQGRPGPLRWLPLLLGVATIPLLAVGGALETINERLLEIPLVLLGSAWLWLGYLLVSSGTWPGNDRLDSA